MEQRDKYNDSVKFAVQTHSYSSSVSSNVNSEGRREFQYCLFTSTYVGYSGRIFKVHVINKTVVTVRLMIPWYDITQQHIVLFNQQFRNFHNSTEI